MKYLLRIRDKNSKYFCDKLDFLEKHRILLLNYLTILIFWPGNFR